MDIYSHGLYALVMTFIKHCSNTPPQLLSRPWLFLSTHLMCLIMRIPSIVLMAVGVMGVMGVMVVVTVVIIPHLPTTHMGRMGSVHLIHIIPRCVGFLQN